MKLLLAHTPEMRNNYYGDRALGELRTLAKVELHDQDVALTPSQLVARGHDADVIIADRMTTGPSEVFSSLPTLKAFVRCAVDIRNIDVTAASVAGVLVTHARPGFVESVTELTVGLLVDLARGISSATREYQAGRVPAARMGRQLAGSTIGIIGYGSIGRHLADLASNLGMAVLVHDPHVLVKDSRMAQASLEQLLAEADHVVCLAVATKATENLIDASAFGRMKSDAVFINVSRGNLVDEEALADALQRRTIAGAAMDVGRAPDQMPSSAVAALPNVVATPHIGGLTPPAIEAQAMDTVDQIRELLRGEVPHGSVNAEHWTRKF